MATYTIGVTAFDYSEARSVENPENAYDSSATTYATVQLEDYTVYLYGFNFSKIPSGEVVTDISVKVKSTGDALEIPVAWLQSTNDSTGVKLSQDVSFSSSTATTKTIPLTADINTVMSYKDTLSIAIKANALGVSFNLYAVYLTVDTVTASANKIIYGNETLIDLTGDTATEADVASGKTFHLASGVQATGALVASPSVATATTTGSTTRTVSFTVSKEPSWFMMIFASATTSERSYRVYAMRYNGTATKTFYGYSSTAGTLMTSDSYGTFSYSSGTLTITVNTQPYLGAAGWTLYYL